MPVETHGIAAIGLRDLLRTIEDARDSQVNPTVVIGASWPTRFDRTKEAKDCVRQTRGSVGKHERRSRARCCKRLSPRVPALERRFSYARTIVEHDGDGMAAADYRAVADELLERWKLSASAQTNTQLVGGRRVNPQG